MTRKLLVSCLALCVVTTVAHAIVGRHDADLVANEAQMDRFVAVCKILPDGEGVLIAPDWVLTAAHVATGPRRGRLRVQLAGVDYGVAAVVPFEGWRGGHDDIALMRLTRPVRGVEPLALHGGELAEAAVVWLAGRGDFGDGVKRVGGNDGKLRVANNAVSKLEPDRIFIRLDAPDDGALAAEGISGPGDSGTPLLVDNDGKLAVVGVGSVGISPGPGRYGEYGSQDVFIRTSHFREWIEQTIGGR